MLLRLILKEQLFMQFSIFVYLGKKKTCPINESKDWKEIFNFICLSILYNLAVYRLLLKLFSIYHERTYEVFYYNRLFTENFRKYYYLKCFYFASFAEFKKKL